MNRTLNVVRMQLVNRQTFIWVPLIVLTGALAVTLAVYGILLTAGVEGNLFGGGVQAPLWYFAVVGAQSLTLTFPFSQAMSVSRREFYIGTLATAAVTAGILSLVFVAGGLVEQLTSGWGMNGYFFRLEWIWSQGPVVAGLMYFAIAMLFFVVGFAGATIFKRFGAVTLTTASLVLALLLVGAAWLVGQTDGWGALFTRIGDAGPVGVTLVGAGVVALLAAVSFPLLRRAVP